MPDAVSDNCTERGLGTTLYRLRNSRNSLGLAEYELGEPIAAGIIGAGNDHIFEIFSARLARVTMWVTAAIGPCGSVVEKSQEIELSARSEALT